MFLKIFLAVLLIITILVSLPILKPYKCYECYENIETEAYTKKTHSDNANKISKIYKERGLLFRGLENCSGGITSSCIEKEIDGPHEPVPGVIKNQGATTFLKGGEDYMNPIFYTDLHGGSPIILIFTPDIVTEDSCSFIQDAGLNGCPDNLEVCGNFNQRKDKCSDIDCSSYKKCNIGDSDLEKHECIVNNCYFKDCFNAKTPTDVGGKCYFAPYNCDAQWQHANNKNPNPKYFKCAFNDKNQLSDLQKGYNEFNHEMKNLASSDKEIFESGAILMKENQVSSFWDSTNLEHLLGVGYIYDLEDPDNEKTATKLYPYLVSFQEKIKETYSKTLPIIQITRNIEPGTPFIKNENNGSIYYGQFNKLEFYEIIQ